MTHKFDPIHMNRLDSPERRTILPPEEILHKLALSLGNNFLDIGAGLGYFSIPAARIVQHQGKVVAVDTSLELLAELRRRVAASGLDNIEVVHSDEYDFFVPENAFDQALISTVLHEVEDKPRFLGAAWKALKPGGQLAVIDWIKKPMDRGPAEHDRVDILDVVSFFNNVGYSNIVSNNYNDYFYVVIGVKG